MGTRLSYSDSYRLRGSRGREGGRDDLLVQYSLLSFYRRLPVLKRELSRKR